MLGYEQFLEIQSVIHSRIHNPEKAGCYQFWLRSFIDFHKLDSLNSFSCLEVTMFLEYLAGDRGAGFEQLESARKALNFYFRNVLNKNLDSLRNAELSQQIASAHQANRRVSNLNFSKIPSVSMFPLRPQH
ncbi:MAG: phage integrase N-terminal SAM-like domain-containing protein [Oceanobacter sp.]